jgi:pimeloyl-ACP methyl ester carboxylesterase
MRKRDNAGGSRCVARIGWSFSDSTAALYQVQGYPEVQELFFQLIDQALGEVMRREPSYLARFPLTFPPPALSAEAYHQRPQLQDLRSDEIEDVLKSGVEHIAEAGGCADAESAQRDPVAEMMLDSMMDAFLADRQKIRLSVADEAPRTLTQILRDDYEERHTPGGVRYLSRRYGDRPLVLISACGIPLAIWSTFLGDSRHSFKIIIVQTKNTDLLLGGMQDCRDLTSDGADIVAALDSEGIGEADLLAWCNGARTAVALADRCSGRFRSLTLLSPALRGIEGVTPQPSAFENTMSDMFDMLAQKPKLATYFVDNFGKQSGVVDWDALGDDASRRAGALFGLAAREHSKTLLAPFLQHDSLLNLGRRLASDQTYPTHQALSRLKIPILLITGDHDMVVNSKFAAASLAKWAPAFIHVKVSGAGHYIQDLQYSYFLSIMDDFLSNQPLAASTRLDVVPLNARRQ